MTTIRRLLVVFVCALLSTPVLGGVAHAALPTVPTFVLIAGEIERITVTNPADVWSGGTIVVGGQNVIIPRNLLADFPANRLTIQQLFAQAPPACVTRKESGIAKTDACNTSGSGGVATIAANRLANGNVIAGDIMFEKGVETVGGTVTFINFASGFLRVNGAPNDPTTGIMVRFNDPTTRHTVQSGAGCLAGAPNCSADTRFNLDPDNYTHVTTTGYPTCIPSTVRRTFTDRLGVAGPVGANAAAQAAPDGTGDVLCPTTNRPASLIAGDSRRFAPILVGDNFTAFGNWETIGGVRFLSAWGSTLAVGLSTQNAPGQPDYMTLGAEVDAPAFFLQRIRAVFDGNTTNPVSDVVIWSTHHDPTTNAVHEFPLASVNGCTAAGRAACQPRANLFHIQYHVDFRKSPPAVPATSPCDHLRNEPRLRPQPCPQGGTLAEQFATMSPITHELQARTGIKMADMTRPNPTLFTIDILGADAKNGQYLMPMGIGLGGISTGIPLGVDLVDKGMTPYSFDGIPWNLDRRLSPGGCIGACESTPQPLDPFPIAGFDPRRQAPTIPTSPYNDPTFTASTLSFASDRVLSFVDARVGNFNGDRSLLSWPPTSPAAQAIRVTPLLTAIKGLVTGLTPTSGPVGQTVLIDGSGLGGASNVTFGSTPATSFRNVTPTQISAVVPVGAVTGPIAVTTALGSWTSDVRFEVVPAPALDTLTPSNGPVGTPVTLGGAGFLSATNVAFNGVQSPFTVISDTAIRTVVPAGATTGSVTVTNPGGVDPSAGRFTVTPPAPSITSIGPGSGPVGTSVTIVGRAFTGATNVAVNGITATFTVGSDTSITVTIPAAATTGTVTVTTPAGTATSPSPFTVTAPRPTISSFTPASGPVGTSVTLTGTAFTGATSVAVNGITATFTVGSDTSITLAVPAGATTGTITVTTPAGTATSPTSYTVA